MYDIEELEREYSESHESVSGIVNSYVEWVNDTQYIILQRWNGFKSEVYAVKCSKRGNDVHRSRVRRRFDGLAIRAGDLAFFNPKDRGSKMTRALWVTLTYDAKLCSFGEAWKRVGIEFNRFMAYVRKRFGRVSCCRVFESFENGYAHIHAILLFESKWFRVFRDKKGQFRIHSKKTMEKGWHSNIDVKAMSSLAGSFSYLKKYLMKGIDVTRADSKGLKTLALCWEFRKRAFSVSGLFRKMLSDLVKEMKHKLVQIDLYGVVVEEEKFHYVGIVSAAMLSLKEDVWYTKLDPELSANIQEYLTHTVRA